MRTRRAAILIAWAALAATATPSRAERLVTSLSNHQVLITSNFTGADLVLFGSIERDAATIARSGGYDIVVTVIGARSGAVVRRKERVFGIWVNTDSRTFIDAPGYLAVAANRSVEEIAGPDIRSQFRIGLDQIRPQQIAPGGVIETTPDDPSRTAFLRLKKASGLYSQRENAITFLTPTLFRANIPLPADAPIGTYEIDVKLFGDGVILAREASAFEIVKVGFEQFVANAAHEHGTLYGVATAGMALLIGFFASVIFRRD